MADSPRLVELRRRVHSDPASIAFAALAEEYRRAKRLPDAIETARAGLARHPSYATARVTLGRALFESGAIEDARLELQQALASAPENLAAIRALAELFRHTGAQDRARELVRRGVALAPQDRELRALLDSLGPGPSAAAPAATVPPVSGPAIAVPALTTMPTARQHPLAAIDRLERWLGALARERARRAEPQPVAAG